MADTEKQYSDLKKKHGLPDFALVDAEFEISDIDSKFLLRHINRRIAEKVDFYTGVIEEMLQPDTSNIYALHENRYFDENEKKSMYDLYKNLMFINRNLLQLALKRNEKEDAQFLKNFIEEWKAIKQELVKYVETMKSSWKSDIESKEDVGYMG